MRVSDLCFVIEDNEDKNQFTEVYDVFYNKYIIGNKIGTNEYWYYTKCNGDFSNLFYMSLLELACWLQDKEPTDVRTTRPED